MNQEIASRTYFVGLLVGLAHIASGIAVLIAPGALLATPMDFIGTISNYLGFKNGFPGALLLCIGTVAVVAATHPMSMRTRAIMFAPQQALLLLQIIAISIALVYGEYPDGYQPVGRAWFILADQVWAFLLAISHSIWLAALLYGGGERGRNT